MTTRVIAPRFGSVTDVVLETLDDVAPGDGRVAIAVRAAAVNPYDAKSILGLYGSDESRLPLKPGSEVSGVVTAVGADAVGPAGPIAVGDEVIAFRLVAGLADRVIAKAANVLPKPESLSFEEGAALMVAATTAWHLLESTRVGEGDRVLVHGASGSAGSAAVQLAVARGARVVGTASARNADLVRSLGAEWVEYGPGLADRVRAIWPEGATAALDAVGTDEAVDTSVELVDDLDRIATIASFQRGAAAGIHLLGAGGDPGDELRMAARLPILDLATAGRLHVRVAEAFPLERAADALALVAGGHPGGKVVLVP